MDPTIKQGFPEDSLINLIKPTHEWGDKKLVSNYWTIMVSSIVAKLYNIIME